MTFSSTLPIRRQGDLKSQKLMFGAIKEIEKFSKQTIKENCTFVFLHICTIFTIVTVELVWSENQVHRCFIVVTVEFVSSERFQSSAVNHIFQFCLNYKIVKASKFNTCLQWIQNLKSSRCGGLFLHAWVGWMAEIKYGLIAAARGTFTSWRSISANGRIVIHHETA